MRIVAGAARGRRLAAPAPSTRPTSDRVREALFSSIESRLGALGGLRVLDLYAGSGAVGLEALSRGAGHVLLVEKDRKALEVIRANIAVVGMPGAVVLGNDVTSLTSAAPPPSAVAPYDVVFADPPYETPGDVVEATLAGLAGRGWLGEGSLVVVERARRRGGFTWPEGFDAPKERAYGDTVVRTALWYGRPALLP
jgi:16S rRNA (guanine966-N2)-methyltransferase